MPTYDYQCSHCNDLIEIFHSITESARKKCPQCGELTLKRLISVGAGVLFKGDGFYVTDSKKKNSSSSDASVKTTDANKGTDKNKGEQGTTSSDTTVKENASDKTKKNTETMSSSHTGEKKDISKK